MWWVSEIWSEGFFKYDPTNYHGPLLFYLFHWLEALGAKSLEAYRALTSFFNVALIGLIIWWSEKRKSDWWRAGLLIVLSPAMIFFSRSAIHESAFVFFQVMAFLGVVDFFKYSRISGIRLFVGGLLGALLLKETFVLPFISGLIVLISSIKEAKLKLSDTERKELIKLLAGAFFVWFLFYTGFFANFAGLFDFFRAFMPWTSVGISGNGHEKPIYYWLQLILNHEPLTLVAMIFTLANFLVPNTFAKKISLFALIHFLFYSLIPYKTPWCLISLVWPFYFSGLEGFRHFWPRLRKQSQFVLTVAFVALGIYQIKEVSTLVYKTPIHFEHDYVYVQTGPGAQRAFDFIEQLNRNNAVLVYTDNPWPFPAVLKGFHKVYPLVPQRDITAQDFSNLPKDLGLIIMESDPEKQTSLLLRLGVKRKPCDEVFQENLTNCQFEIIPGTQIYQLILVGEP